MAASVLIVEDQRLVREILRAAIDREPGFRVVGEAGSGREAAELGARLRPQIVVLDLILPDTSGMEVARALSHGEPPPAIIILSSQTDGATVADALAAGASGYVTKTDGARELGRALRAVSQGTSYLCPEAASALASHLARRGSRGGGDLGGREREVLRLVAQGMRSREIAERLGISTATVEVHRRNIMAKLGKRTVAELTQYAVRHKIVGA